MPQPQPLKAGIFQNLDDLDVRRGAPLGINQSSGDQFDAIVYAERQERHWMAGSSGFKRTEDAVPGFEETETDVLIKMVISYEDDGSGQAHIRIYRNDNLIGDYTKGPLDSGKLTTSWAAIKAK